MHRSLSRLFALKLSQPVFEAQSGMACVHLVGSQLPFCPGFEPTTHGSHKPKATKPPGLCTAMLVNYADSSGKGK